MAAPVFRNVVPGCGCGGVDILPGQVLVNQPAYTNLIPGLAPGLISPAIVNGQYALPGTNIIQDNSVANNLANTLQLLLVSNLLSNTLPNAPELVVPAVPSCGCCNGVSYIY
ncbi:hypothetical protein MSG28_014949 [Choristoneura fumiferana]|uniref:Uncharacterized protein n=2 Tax=Choristoneura fumiferana TaxID=7141 RepID=A0ACC0KXZ8_CHOFU|nr:hypothetical protein MSG28_014949 [Choristoneura fumiferana]